MKGLDTRKYIAVPFEEKEVLPWIADRSEIHRLKSNAAYLKSLKKYFSIVPLQSHLKSIQEHPEANYEEIELDECTKQFGLQSCSIKSGGTLTPEEYYASLSAPQFALLTERFFGRPYINFGSGRHALARDVQLKGVGLNALALSEDFYHRWGGMIVRDSLKAFLSDVVATKRTKLGTMRLLASFVFKNQSLGKIPVCLQVRDARSYRLAQIHPDFLTGPDVMLVRSHLEGFFQVKNPAAILDRIIEHYVHAYSVGVHYRSANFDDLMVNGRFIDCESIDFTVDQRPVPRFITISVPRSSSLGSLDQASLGEFLLKQTDVRFMDSSSHYLYKLGVLTHYIFKGLWPDLKYDPLERTKAISQVFLKDHLKDEDWKLLDTHKSSTLISLMGQPLEEFSPITSNALSHHANFKYNHHFEDPPTDTTVICFAEGLEKDLRFECNEILKKLEVAFWPHYDSCTWEKAFETYDKILSTVG